jgi:HD-like signal output (HDOD) protein
MSQRHTLAAYIMQAVEDNKLVLPTLPEVALQIRRCEDNPNLDVMELARTIEHDPATAAQILRIANSPLLRREVKVADLSKAISLLGINYTAKLAVSFALKQLFSSTNPDLQHQMRNIWAHSMKVACHCYVLARHAKLMQEEAFLAGLLHQIGALPIISMANQTATYDENELLNTIHQLHPMLGEQILSHWQFPREIADVPQNYTDGNRYISRVDYCDLVTIASNHLQPDDDKHPWADIAAIERLGWHAPEADEKLAALQDEIDLAYEIFNG